MRYYDQLENKELVRLCENEDTSSLLYVLGQRLDMKEDEIELLTDEVCDLEFTVMTLYQDMGNKV